VKWEQVEVGRAETPAGTGMGPLEFFDVPLTVTDFVRHQGGSGDMNPIHNDSEFAIKTRYPGPFAVHVLQAGVMAACVADWLGPESFRRFKVQFREQAWPGDVIRYCGVDAAKRELSGERVIDLDYELRVRPGVSTSWPGPPARRTTSDLSR
jgi:acyl dehydratase